MGAMGKSAQFLLHTWLPDAMEGPTPVSALIHAATMVTAGVFMVARLSPLFDLAPTALSVVTIVGGDDGVLRRDRRPGAERHQARHRLFDLLAARLHVRRRSASAATASASSTCSRTPSSRRCCSSAPARSSTRCITSRTCARWAACKDEIPVHLLDDDDRHAGADRRRHSVHARSASPAMSRRTRSSRRPTPRTAPARSTPSSASCIAAGLTSFYSWRLVFMTFFGKRGDWAALAAGRARTATTTMRMTPWRRTARSWPCITRARIAARDADPARRAGGRRDVRGHRCSATGSSAAASRASGSTRSFIGPDNKILEEMETVPWLVSLLPTLMMLGGFVVAYYMYIVDKTAPARLANAQPAALPLPAQQVVFRRALRLPVRAAGVLARPRCSGRAATASSSTASGPTAFRRACST